MDVWQHMTKALDTVETLFSTAAEALPQSTQKSAKKVFHFLYEINARSNFLFL